MAQMFGSGLDRIPEESESTSHDETQFALVLHAIDSMIEMIESRDIVINNNSRGRNPGRSTQVMRGESSLVPIRIEEGSGTMNSVSIQPSYLVNTV